MKDSGLLSISPSDFPVFPPTAQGWRKHGSEYYPQRDSFPTHTCSATKTDYFPPLPDQLDCLPVCVTEKCETAENI